jgi:hypothetical protein
MISDGGNLLEIDRLTEAEKKQIRECEVVLQKGLATFFEVGSVLLTIREGRLYRSSFSTFEGYCRERWGIGRSYAWRVIGAAERMKLLPSDGTIPKPGNEFQIRPFLKLDPTDFPKAWNEAISHAQGGKLTPKLIASVVRGLCDRKESSLPKSRLAKRRRLSEKISLGRILALLQEARHQIKKGESEQALVALESIECALFSQ